MKLWSQWGESGRGLLKAERMMSIPLSRFTLKLTLNSTIKRTMKQMYLHTYIGNKYQTHHEANISTYVPT